MDVQATLTSGGRITLPKPVRDALGLKSGDRVLFRISEERAVLTKIEDFLALAGSVCVSPEKKGTSWPAIKAATWSRRGGDSVAMMSAGRESDQRHRDRLPP
jgi:antitoxin PrlF